MKSASGTILLVEDEDSLAIGLADVLEARGYSVVRVEAGESALELLNREFFDLVLLDVELPGMSGLDVLKRLREQGSEVRVLMLTARGSELDKVVGFERGADDYVAKPFSLAELLGRIQALLRRSPSYLPDTAPASEANLLELGEASVDFRRFKVKRQGEELDGLPSKLFPLLECLYNRRGEVVTRDELIDAVWGEEECVTVRTLNNLIVKIRQAIERTPDNPRYLVTVHGVGYRLEWPIG